MLVYCACVPTRMCVHAFMCPCRPLAAQWAGRSFRDVLLGVPHACHVGAA
jgi:hypothetical protein